MSETQHKDLNRVERDLAIARAELKHAQCFMMATTDLREEIIALENRRNRILAHEKRRRQQAENCG